MPIGTIRAVARALMPQFVARGMTSNGIHTYLRNSFGSSYRNTVLLSDLREFRHVAKYQIQIEKLDKTKSMPRTYMLEAELRREKRYMVKGIVTKRNMDTGDETQEYGTMYTDEYGTKEFWSDKYMSYQVESESDPSNVVVGFDVIGVTHYKGRPY